MKHPCDAQISQMTTALAGVIAGVTIAALAIFTHCFGAWGCQSSYIFATGGGAVAALSMGWIGAILMKRDPCGDL